MKTFFRFIVFSALITTALSGCNKNDDTVFNSYFYTSRDTSEVNLSLYIDDRHEGTLPYLTGKPACDDIENSSTQAALSRTLESGKYKITAKDEGGNVISETVLKIKRNSASARGKTGGDEITVKDDCLVINLF